jgi:hypothetical protein
MRRVRAGNRRMGFCPLYTQRHAGNPATRPSALPLSVQLSSLPGIFPPGALMPLAGNGTGISAPAVYFAVSGRRLNGKDFPR